MTFAFGGGTVPEHLTAELDLTTKLVHFRATEMDEDKSRVRDICSIPLSQLLLLRENLSEEVRNHLCGEAKDR